MSVSTTMQPQESVSLSMALGITKSCDCPWSTLPPGATLISMGCTELALSLTACSTQEHVPTTSPVPGGGSQPRGDDSSRAWPILHLSWSRWHGWGTHVQLTLLAGLAHWSVVRMQENWRSNQLNYIQVQIQVYELAHPNTHPINKLLEHMKGLVLQSQGGRVSHDLGQQ